MLIDFFYTLRAAKLPVSVKELLTLLEALDKGLVGPRSQDAWSLDDFYFLARTCLVKDEKLFDKFDQAFSAYFKGMELLTDWKKELPEDWLKQVLERELSAEEKAAIEAMEKRLQAGISAGVTGTPYFTVNGVKVADTSLSGLSEVIDAELAK